MNTKKNFEFIDENPHYDNLEDQIDLYFAQCNALEWEFLNKPHTLQLLKITGYLITDLTEFFGVIPRDMEHLSREEQEEKLFELYVVTLRKWIDELRAMKSW